MSVRFTVTVAYAVSSTVADEKDLGKGQTTVKTDAQESGGSWKTLVPAASTDLEVNLDNISDAKFLLLKTNPRNENDPAQEITVKLNLVGADAIPITPFADKKIGFFLVTTQGLSTIFVSNAGTVDVELTVVVAGD